MSEFPVYTGPFPPEASRKFRRACKHRYIPVPDSRYVCVDCGQRGEEQEPAKNSGCLKDTHWMVKDDITGVLSCAVCGQRGEVDTDV